MRSGLDTEAGLTAFLHALDLSGTMPVHWMVATLDVSTAEGTAAHNSSPE